MSLRKAKDKKSVTAVTLSGVVVHEVNDRTVEGPLLVKRAVRV